MVTREQVVVLTILRRANLLAKKLRRRSNTLQELNEGRGLRSCRRAGSEGGIQLPHTSNREERRTG